MFLAGFRRHRTYAAAVVACIGVGVAAASASFALLYATAIAPLPFKAPDRLVRISGAIYPRDGDIVEWLERLPALESVAVCRTGGMNLSLRVAPERVTVAETSASFFSLLGVSPVLGRVFTSDDEDRQRNHLALLSYRTWQDRFEANLGIIGVQFLLNDAGYTVVGVMPREFRFPGRTDIWIPRDSRRAFESERLGSDSAVGAGVFRGNVLARLRVGYSPEVATKQLRGLQGGSLPPALRSRFYVSVNYLRDGLLGSRRGAVYAVVAAAIGLFVSLCVTLLNLVLLHESARMHDVSIRYSLGATPLHLARMKALEWACLASLGCGLALLLTAWAIPSLRAVGPEYFPPVAALSTNGASVLSSLVLSLVLSTIGLAGSAGSLFQRWPPVEINWSSSADLSRGSSRQQSSVRRRIALVQVVLTVPLLFMAVSEAKNFERLTSIDSGFELGSRYVVRVQLPTPRFDPPSARAFYERAVAELRAIPGVVAAGYAENVPFDGQTIGRAWYQPEGITLDDGDAFANLHTVSRDFVKALGMEVVQGTSFPAHCATGVCDVALIDERSARRLWGDSPLGRTVRLGDVGVRTIGGVVRFVRFGVSADDDAPHLFLLAPNAPLNTSLVFAVTPGWNQRPWAMRMLRGLDDGVAVGPIVSFETLLSDAVASPRRRAYASVAFVGVALFIAFGSMWSVLAFALAQRRQELAVRSACGAPPEVLFWHIVAPAIMSQAVAVAVGAGLSAALGWGLSHVVGSASGGDSAIALGCAMSVWLMAGCLTGILAWRELKANVFVWGRLRE
jgi:predicted permease